VLSARITDVLVERVERSMWGSFWEIQRTAPSSSPMSPHPKFANSLESWFWPQAVVLVRVETNCGECGIGWAEDGVGAASNIIQRHLRRFLIGADPEEYEILWDQMFRASIPYGRKGAAIEAISAIDLALWDLRARMRGLPVYRLAGNGARRTVLAYASHLQPVSMDLFVKEALTYVDQGFRAMKMRMPGIPCMGADGIRQNVERVRAVREAVGEGIGLMVDAYMGWDLGFALRMAEALAPYRLRWIEEPLLPDEIGDYSELRKGSAVPIAAGEHEFTHYGFRELIERQAVDIVQPDLHRVGGLTAALRVCDLAADAGLGVAPHVFSAPTVHLAAAHHSCLMVEKLTVPVWVREPPANDPLLAGEPEVVNGQIALNDAPGFGVSVNAGVFRDLRTNVE